MLPADFVCTDTKWSGVDGQDEAGANAEGARCLSRTERWEELVGKKIAYEDGQKLGELIFVRECNTKYGQKGWQIRKAIFRCRCGTEFECSINMAKGGYTKSCGKGSCRHNALGEGEAAANHVYSQYKINDAKKGRVFSVSFEEFKALSQMPCFYCGEERSNVCRHDKYFGEFVYNGLDRVDNALGHVVGNVVACCKTCNKAKLEMSVDQFLNWAFRLVAWQLSKADIWSGVTEWIGRLLSTTALSVLVGGTENS